ncbi:S8 family serine peptidase [bacterium]|nr:S8 family serine peptidase [bacterium]
MTVFKRVLVPGILMAVLFGICRASSVEPQNFDARIETDLKPEPEHIIMKDGKWPVGVIRTPDWRLVQYTEEEVIFKPKGEDELRNFIRTYEGTVIHDGMIQPVPAQFKTVPRKIPEKTGYYRIRINTQKISTDHMKDHANQLNIGGTYFFSSEKMVRLFALILEARVSGNDRISMNQVLDSFCVMRASQEHPRPSENPPDPDLYNDGYENAFDWTGFNDPDIRVTEAWRLLEWFGLDEDIVPLCVIDRGFELNADFPAARDHAYDFVEEDQDVDANEANYHGTMTLSMACAKLDNRFGAAGTGAPVALPMPFRYDGTVAQGAHAICTAVAWGAEIINCSWGHYCSIWDESSDEVGNMADAIELAHDQNVIVVAAAGNDGLDIGDSDITVLPAESGAFNSRPLVVGGIDLVSKEHTFTEMDGSTWSSNYGSPVNIWAPGGPGYRIETTPTPDSGGQMSHPAGTSIAAPYISGVVAMIRALIPGISIDEVREILRSNANRSPDPLMTTGFVNAEETLSEIASRDDVIRPTEDVYEPNNFARAANFEPGAELLCANHYASDSQDDTEDAYRFYVDDFRDVSINEGLFVFGRHATEIRGFYQEPVTPPFESTLRPGTYYVHSLITAASPRVCFYSIQLTQGDPVEIDLDRFENNNSLGTAAEIEYPDDRLNASWTIEDVNFHVHDDPDFFEVSVPDWSVNPVGSRSDRLTIWVEPNENGFNSTFHISTYDESGRLGLSVGRPAVIENFRAAFPGGRMRFSIEDWQGNRNFYRIILSYQQFIVGNSPDPGSVAFFEIPEWIQAERDIFLITPPPKMVDALMITDFSFPANNLIMKKYLSGHHDVKIPGEHMVIKWTDEKRPFDMMFAYYGKPDDFNYSLLDFKGNSIAIAKTEAVKPIAENGSDRVVKRMDLGYLKRGLYGVRIDGPDYPAFYQVSFISHDKIGKVEGDQSGCAAEERRSCEIPCHFFLYQAYPNPFNPSTEIRYKLPEASRVTVAVFNLAGQRIHVLKNGLEPAGSHSVRWDGTDDSGRAVAGGIYVCRIRAGEWQQAIKMMMVR